MKKNNSIKILVIITIILTIAIVGVSARLISLEREKRDQQDIIDNNNPPEKPNDPDVSKPPIDKDPTPDPPIEEKPTPKPPKDDDKVIVPSKYISKDEAIAIALKRVGSGARLVEIESDLDDNPPKYEIELILGNYEYEIEIHAITGAIIDFDKDEID